MRGYGPLFYLIEAFRGLRANSMVNLLAIGTISMAMVIVGFFLLVFVNLQAAVSAMGDQFEISVYLNDGIAPADRDFLQTRLKAEAGVKKLVFVSKSEALDILRKELRGQEALIEGLAENPLPDSFEVTVDRYHVDTEKMEALATKFSKLPGVEDVSYGRQGVEVMERLLALLKYGGMALAALLGVSVVFIISNSVRLALYSRGQEIELMQWIGATRWFIQGPFLLEGMLVAVGGTVVAVGILAGIFSALPTGVVVFLSGPLGIEFLPPAVIFGMIGCGGALGIAGGLVSVNKFLD